MMAKETSHVLDTLAAEFVPEDVDLWPDISASLLVEERSSLMQTMRARPALLVLVILLTLALFSGVAYALGRALGYIPGVGLVQNDHQVRILGEKVRVTQGGLMLEVRNLVADSEQTILEYRIMGIPWRPQEMTVQCVEAPTLRLPDGATLQPRPASPQWLGGENGYLTLDAKLTFPPLAPSVDVVTLLPPCQIPSVPLHLVPAPAGYVRPATELPATFQASRPPLPTVTPTLPLSTPLIYPPDFPATPTPVPAGSGLYLERVVELKDSYLLIGNFTDAGDLPGSADFLASTVPYGFVVRDQNGEAVRFSIRPDLMPVSPWGNVAYWAIEIWKPVKAPVTILLPALDVSLEGDYSFSIDVGEQPQRGQVWKIDHTVQVGGVDLLVEDVTLSERGYTLRLRSLQSLVSKPYCNLNMEEYQAKELYERFYDHNEYMQFTETLVFDGFTPTGRLTFDLQCFVEKPIGPWTLTWSSGQ